MSIVYSNAAAKLRRILHGRADSPPIELSSVRNSPDGAPIANDPFWESKDFNIIGFTVERGNGDAGGRSNDFRA